MLESALNALKEEVAYLRQQNQMLLQEFSKKTQ